MNTLPKLVPDRAFINTRSACQSPAKRLTRVGVKVDGAPGQRGVRSSVGVDSRDYLSQ